MTALKCPAKTPDSLMETKLQGVSSTVLARASNAACLAANEFFWARLSNAHTWSPYGEQVGRFPAWCEDDGLELHQVTLGLAEQTMLKRRVKAAGLPEILSPHSFRNLVVTDILSQNVPLEDVQYLAGHAHPHTTQICDRQRWRVSRNLVEQISF